MLFWESMNRYHSAVAHIGKYRVLVEDCGIAYRFTVTPPLPPMPRGYAQFALEVDRTQEVERNLLALMLYVQEWQSDEEE